MDKELKIIPPEGYEVDKKHSTFECIKFKPINPLPKTWEEFCKEYPLTGEECWIDSMGYVEYIVKPGKKRNSKIDRNLLPSEEMAKAMLALCQLIQLRDYYNDDWKPDWTDRKTEKHCIGINQNRIIKALLCTTQSILVFKTSELRNKFLENFKDLIETAKPLL